MFPPRLSRFTAVTLTIAGTIAGIGLAPMGAAIAQPKAPRSPVKFTMPRLTYDRGAPGKRGEGASRSSFCSSPTGPIALTPQYSEPRLGADGQPLLFSDGSPQEQHFVLSQTSEARPTFALYLPLGAADVADLQLNLFVMDAAGNDIYDLPIPAPRQAGIVTFKPDLNQAELEEGQRYTWAIEIEVACTENQLNAPSYDNLQGQIERQALSQNPTDLEPKEYAIIAAEQGFWLDAMATVADLRRQVPSNDEAIADWSALLDSIGLGSLATAPLSEATQLLNPLLNPQPQASAPPPQTQASAQPSRAQPSQRSGQKRSGGSRLYPVR